MLFVWEVFGIQISHFLKTSSDYILLFKRQLKPNKKIKWTSTKLNIEERFEEILTKVQITKNETSKI